MLLWFFNIILILNGCTEAREGSGIQTHVKAGVTERQVILDHNDKKEVSIDLKRSIIRWKGTKMMGTGSHEGTVGFRAGTLRITDGKLIDGTLVVDMKSIYITDIPLEDPIPRRNLTTHLNSDFDIKKYPSATFKLEKVNYTNDTILSVIGNLSIKNVTKQIEAKATIEYDGENKFHVKSSFSFNRFDWNIGADGSWLEKKLVDEDIYLTIDIWTN